MNLDLENQPTLFCVGKDTQYAHDFQALCCGELAPALLVNEQLRMQLVCQDNGFPRTGV